MTDFVGYDAAQNYRDFELSVITLGQTDRVLVIDGGENRMDCKTEYGVLDTTVD